MKHPLSITGLVIFLLAWIFLVAGVSGSPYGDVVNLHSLFLAQSGIVSGLGLFVAGIMLEQKHVGDRHVDETPALSASEHSAPAMDPQERKKLAQELRALLTRHVSLSEPETLISQNPQQQRTLSGGFHSMSQAPSHVILLDEFIKD